MINVEYRDIEKNDASIMICYLRKILCESENLTYNIKELEQDVSKMEDAIQNFINSDSIWMAALDKEEIIGTVKVSRFDKSRTKHRAVLGITVKKDYQSIGIGTNLMKKALEKSKEQGIEKIELCVRKDNKNAVKLYEKYGFKVEGDISDYFKISGKYYDAFLMGKMI